MTPGNEDFRYCPRCGGTLQLRALKDGEPSRLVCAACGFVDRGEAVAAAAVRETMEEVNLKVSLTGILDVYSFPGSEVVVIVYAAEVISGELFACDECDEVQVFPPESLPWADLAFESTRAALRDYVRRFFPRVRVPR